MTVDRLAQGYHPDFDIDAALGHQGELFVVDIRKALERDDVEVKTDAVALRTGNVYIEYACLRGGTTWEPSGIATTKAAVWAFVLGAVVLAAATDDVRAVARRYYPTHHRELNRGSHPTRGVAVPIPLYIKALQQQGSTVLRPTFATT